jgi:hypothetical protein
MINNTTIIGICERIIADPATGDQYPSQLPYPENSCQNVVKERNQHNSLADESHYRQPTLLSQDNEKQQFLVGSGLQTLRNDGGPNKNVPSNPVSPVLTFSGLSTHQSNSVASSLMNTPALNASSRAFKGDFNLVPTKMHSEQHSVEQNLSKRFDSVSRQHSGKRGLILSVL